MALALRLIYARAKKVRVLTDIDCDVRSDCLLGADDLDHFNVSHQLRLLRFGEESGLHTDTVRHAHMCFH
jgi:single-stranded DNA-specific DHH superfamily exonuclease